jgi:hypothetical protein
MFWAAFEKIPSSFGHNGAKNFGWIHKYGRLGAPGRPSAVGRGWRSEDIVRLTRQSVGENGVERFRTAQLLMRMERGWPDAAQFEIDSHGYDFRFALFSVPPVLDFHRAWRLTSNEANEIIGPVVRLF